MSYREYKTKYSYCSTVDGSYDKADKTIIVNVEVPEQSDKDAEAILLQILDVYDSLSDQHKDDAKFYMWVDNRWGVAPKRLQLGLRIQDRGNKMVISYPAVSHCGGIITCAPGHGYAFPRKTLKGAKGFEALVTDCGYDYPRDKVRPVYLGEMVDVLEAALEHFKSLTETEEEK